jgi:Glycosyl transferase family group 2
MNMHLWWPVLILALPAIAILIDGVAGVRARDIIYIPGEPGKADFRVLVPIWGSVKYLTNITALASYENVTLCTTGDEPSEFYAALGRIAAQHGFSVFRDHPRGARQAKGRSTGGTTRDRLICNVLASDTIREPYVVPLDADSVPDGDLAVPVGELVRRKLDVASVRIMPANHYESVLTRLQWLEYRLAMQIKFICPWMLSGACHVARTEVLADVMSRHSLFFQANDVEAGLLAERLGYDVGFIPFTVNTDVPAKFRPWLRQRLAWAGGQFRLFIINVRYVFWHPFMWAYGGGITYIALVLRYQSFGHSSWRIAAALTGYLLLVLFLYSRKESGALWVLGMPFYMLIQSFVIIPLGSVWYVKMAVQSRNAGFITRSKNAESKVRYLAVAEQAAS